MVRVSTPAIVKAQQRHEPDNFISLTLGSIAVDDTFEGCSSKVLPKQSVIIAFQVVLTTECANLFILISSTISGVSRVNKVEAMLEMRFTTNIACLITFMMSDESLYTLCPK